MDVTLGLDYNIGYALLWPVFAGFLIWGWFRFRRLERETRSAAREYEVALEALPSRPALPRESDPELDRYNRYIAELNDRELRQKLRAAGLDAGDR